MSENSKPIKQPRRFLRKPIKLPIQINLPNRSLQSEISIENICEGGFFISVNDQIPEPDTHFSFKLLAKDNESIEGHAMVKWLKAQPSGTLPTGFGAEFFYLSPESVEQIRDLLEDASSKDQDL